MSQSVNHNRIKLTMLKILNVQFFSALLKQVHKIEKIDVCQLFDTVGKKIKILLI